MDAGGPGPLWGGPRPRLSAWSFPSLGARGVSGPIQAENRSGAIGLVRKEPGPWAWLFRPLRVVTDNYMGPILLQ